MKKKLITFAATLFMVLGSAVAASADAPFSDRLTIMFDHFVANDDYTDHVYVRYISDDWVTIHGPEIIDPVGEAQKVVMLERDDVRVMGYPRMTISYAVGKQHDRKLCAIGFIDGPNHALSLRGVPQCQGIVVSEVSLVGHGYKMTIKAA